MPNEQVWDKIVSYRSIEKIMKGRESVSEPIALEKFPEDPWERAALMAAAAQALRELEEAAGEADPEVMFSPQNALGSRLQSVLAEQGPDFVPLREGGQELRFDEVTDPLGWIRSWLLDWSDNKHPIKRPADIVAAPFPNEARVAVLGDWGTGLYGAPKCAEAIEGDAKPYTMLLHLGDVYYAGTEKEVRQRFLGFWPKRPEAFSRAINSNHEMYSGGRAYFGVTLPAFNQASSYFALQNDFWMLIGLDTGYTDFDLDPEQVAWLKQVINNAGDRKIVLFSHHQLYSQLDKQGGKLARSLGDLLLEKKLHFWYWGHEHRCVLYDRHDGYGLTARCVGHGGMPQRRGKEQQARVHSQCGDAVWRRLESKPGVPGALVLDGPNAYIKGKEDRYSPHGYVTLEFSDRRLLETVLPPDGGSVLYQAQLA